MKNVLLNTVALRGLFAALLVVFLGAAPVRAQDPGEAEAREHFEVGRGLYDLGQFPEAAAAFERAYELSQRPALLMNIYLSYRDAAQPSQAAEALARYLDSGAVPADDRPALERRLAALRQSRGGGGGGGSSGSSPDLIGPIVLLGAGGALLVAGVITGAVTAAEHSQLETVCPAMRCPNSEAGRLDTIRSLGITTDILIPVGVAAAGAGLVWMIIELMSDGTEDTARASPPVTAFCTSDGCTVTGQGSF